MIIIWTDDYENGWNKKSEKINLSQIFPTYDISFSSPSSFHNTGVYLQTSGVVPPWSNTFMHQYHYKKYILCYVDLKYNNVKLVLQNRKMDF